MGGAAGSGWGHYDLGGEPLAFQSLAKIDDASCRTFAADPPSVKDTLHPETGPPDPLILCPILAYSVEELSSDENRVENSVRWRGRGLGRFIGGGRADVPAWPMSVLE